MMFSGSLVFNHGRTNLSRIDSLQCCWSCSLFITLALLLIFLSSHFKIMVSLVVLASLLIFADMCTCNFTTSQRNISRKYGWWSYRYLNHCLLLMFVYAVPSFRVRFTVMLLGSELFTSDNYIVVLCREDQKLKMEDIPEVIIRSLGYGDGWEIIWFHLGGELEGLWCCLRGSWNSDTWEGGEVPQCLRIVKIMEYKLNGTLWKFMSQLDCVKNHVKEEIS